MRDSKTYWSKTCADKTFTTPFQHELFSQYVSPQAAVLDFGCGYGRTLAELTEQGYTKLTGIDFSPALIERGQAEHPALDLQVYPGGVLPFADESFDAAIMLAVLTCISKTSEQAKVLLELARVLRPGGVLYVNDFLLNRDKRNLDRYRVGQEKHGVYGIFEVPDGGVLRHHDRNHMEALFSGFEILEFEETVYPTMHGHESAGFYSIMKV